MEAYYRAGAMDKGNALAEALFKAISEELAYFQSFPRHFANSIKGELQDRKLTLYYLCNYTRLYDREAFEKFKNQWDTMFPFERWDRILHDDDDDE